MKFKVGDKLRRKKNMSINVHIRIKKISSSKAADEKIYIYDFIMVSKRLFTAWKKSSIIDRDYEKIK